MDLLGAALLRHVERHPAWLATALAGCPIANDELEAAFAAATRDLGRAAITLNEGDVNMARNAGAPWAAQTTVDEVARVVLVRSAIFGVRDPVGVVRRLYNAGDNRERIALLRALPLLRDPASFLSIAIDGCRTNVKPVFDAIACENPYPARWFPEDAFCQMVLKAIFIGTPIARIEGLRERNTPELRRMARGYASERRAAGRDVPDDVYVLLDGETRDEKAGSGE
jgi:hypothetical protein